MRALGLLAVLVAAKAMVLARYPPAWSVWTPFAYFWQDALVVAVFALVRRGSWALYAAIVFYTAINVPVELAVGTPLTWPMLRAARGPLADSMLQYVTWTNAVLVAALLALAVIASRLRRHARPVTFAIVSIAALGPFAETRVDTAGLGRNAVVALISSVVVAHASHPAGERTPPFEAPAENHPALAALRGAGKGFNIVLVSLESTGAQYVNAQTMPRLAELSRRAIVFDNAYAVYPESIKGLATVLGSAPALPAVLARAGYRTALFHSGRFDYLGMNDVIRNRGYDVLEDAGDIGGNHHSSFGVDEPATVARMLQWLDSISRDRPFFLTYLPIAGHHPYDSPERGPFAEDDEIGRYRNALHYGDYWLGVLADGLRDRGLRENTIWIIYGDHGEAFGQHQGNFGHTFFLYEENVHVPMLIVAPGLLDATTHVTRPVSLIDIAPTLVDVVGLSGAGFQGASMLDPASRLALFSTDYSLRLAGLRDGHWKYIEDASAHRGKLFDLANDPEERRDISSQQPARAARYAAILRR